MYRRLPGDEMTALRSRMQGARGGEIRAVARDHMGWLVLAVLVVAAVLFVKLTRMQPEYDAYGWLVWGKQALHWNLDTNGAPSWKPLTFLFTFPYALAGRGQPFLWMATSVGAAFAGAAVAAHLAYRLTGEGQQQRVGRVVAAALAGVGVLGIAGYWPLILIASADPMTVTLCLAAIDLHLSRRPRLAFAMLVLASLSRPEAWPFTAGYAVWAWRSVPGMRIVVVAGLAAIPALWFGISALTARTWLRAGEVALGTKAALHHNKLDGVIDRFTSQYELPMQLAALAGAAYAIVRRDRVLLVLTGCAAAWVAIEIAFAFHGWPAETRYMAEPAAVMVVVAATALGRLLSWVPHTRLRLLLRVAEVAAVVGFAAVLAPIARNRVDVVRAGIAQRRVAGLKIERLAGAIARVGGPAGILACGTPVSIVGYQSTLAWELGLNVGFVGHRPSRAIQRGYPIVLFRPYQLGWEILPIHILPGQRKSCRRLRTITAYGPAGGVGTQAMSSSGGSRLVQHAV